MAWLNGRCRMLKRSGASAPVKTYCLVAAALIAGCAPKASLSIAARKAEGDAIIGLRKVSVAH
jgi:hypothetical protein